MSGVTVNKNTTKKAPMKAITTASIKSRKSFKRDSGRGGSIIELDGQPVSIFRGNLLRREAKEAERFEN